MVPEHTDVVLDGVQCFDENGEEYFLTVIRGRRPDVRDTLRVSGRGKTRADAFYDAVRQWIAAWRSLETKSHSSVAAGSSTT